MVQEFQVVRCCQCQTFQVHQVKKAKKWACKLCGQKQSYIKVFGQGSGADCRRHVQKLNLLRGETTNLPVQQDDVRSSVHAFSTASDDLTGTHKELCPEDGAATVPSSGSRWEQFLTSPEEEEDADDVSEDFGPLEGAFFTTDKQQFDTRNTNRREQGRQRIKRQHGNQHSDGWQKRRCEEQRFENAHPAVSCEELAKGTDTKRRAETIEQRFMPRVSTGYGYHSAEYEQQQQHPVQIGTQICKMDKSQDGVFQHQGVGYDGKLPEGGSTYDLHSGGHFGRRHTEVCTDQHHIITNPAVCNNFGACYDSMQKSTHGERLKDQGSPAGCHAKSEVLNERTTIKRENKIIFQTPPHATSKWATFMDAATVDEDSSSADENYESFVNLQHNSELAVYDVKTSDGKYQVGFQDDESGFESGAAIGVGSRGSIPISGNGGRGSTLMFGWFGGNSLFSTEDDLDHIIDEI